MPATVAYAGPVNEVWQAGEDEWATYRAVRLAGLADAPDAFGSTLDQELAMTEQDWRDRFSQSAIFLGKHDGEVRATAAGLELAEGEIELVGVWAHPDARGTGLAGEVIQAVLDWANGAKKVTAWVAEANPRAERLYLKLGFERTGLRGPLPRDHSIMEVELALRTD